MEQTKEEVAAQEQQIWESPEMEAWADHGEIVAKRLGLVHFAACMLVLPEVRQISIGLEKTRMLVHELNIVIDQMELLLKGMEPTYRLTAKVPEMPFGIFLAEPIVDVSDGGNAD
ncbi:hypothetical protein AWB69_05980 [Caballeronia udeis]|uniref:Uncharacterized protein n=1 Tax=Caballeronia udeis TaxID=1232866 RepID=A0A158IG96_9BURK|nr:hypothetical protein [Caballeronia udeis]SAL55652.1 hypothetical protein AWB69_05980 [Caballeronia udeis]